MSGSGGEIPLHLKISTVTGQNFNIKAFRSFTISDIKNEIESVYGVPAEAQILIWDNRVLENESLLYSYSIDSRSSISLAVKMRNGIKSNGLIGRGENTFVLLCKRDSRYYILEMATVNQRVVLRNVRPLKQDNLRQLQQHLDRDQRVQDEALESQQLKMSQTTKISLKQSSESLLSSSSSSSSSLKLPSVIPSINSSNCLECGKRLGLTNSFKCRCGGSFCSKHRFNDQHKCSHDYRLQGKKELTDQLLSKKFTR